MEFVGSIVIKSVLLLVYIVSLILITGSKKCSRAVKTAAVIITAAVFIGIMIFQSSTSPVTGEYVSGKVEYWSPFSSSLPDTENANFKVDLNMIFFDSGEKIGKLTKFDRETAKEEFFSAAINPEYMNTKPEDMDRVYKCKKGKAEYYFYFSEDNTAHVAMITRNASASTLWYIFSLTKK